MAENRYNQTEKAGRSRRYHRRPSPLTALVLVLASPLLLAACTTSTGGDTATEDVAKAGAKDTYPAPEFTIEVFDNDDYDSGQPVSLSQFQGQPVVLNFWYPSCPPCRLEMPDLEATYQKHKKDGVQFVGVQLLGLDSVEDGQEFIDEFGTNYAVGADPDGSIVRDFKIISFPTTLFIDRNQGVVRRWAGVLTAEKLEELIQELL